MNIADIAVFDSRGREMERPVYPAWAAGTSKSSQHGIVVKVSTDEGIIGYGSPGYGAAPVIDMFQWYLPEPIRVDPADGCMPVPEGPGLGIDIDEEYLRSHARA